VVRRYATAPGQAACFLRPGRRDDSVCGSRAIQRVRSSRRDSSSAFLNGRIARIAQWRTTRRRVGQRDHYRSRDHVECDAARPSQPVGFGDSGGAGALVHFSRMALNPSPFIDTSERTFPNLLKLAGTSRIGASSEHEPFPRPVSCWKRSAMAYVYCFCGIKSACTRFRLRTEGPAVRVSKESP
jgi:hypothetical protein